MYEFDIVGECWFCHRSPPCEVGCFYKWRLFTDYVNTVLCTPLIYNKKDDDRIYSVQIDHIVVGPTGIYLIETKNWSKNSLESKGLFSPVKQLRRHNYAIFVLLNKAVGEGELAGFSGHWGERKISPKNIILLTGHKPKEEYQYVKILSVSEIVRYISYKGREPMFSEEELKSLVDYLIYLT